MNIIPLTEENKLDAEIKRITAGQILPFRLDENPVYAVTALRMEKGGYMVNLFNQLYQRQQRENPYKAEDFTVEHKIISDTDVIEISFPEKTLYPGTCSRLFIAYDTNIFKTFYMALEVGFDEKLHLCSYQLNAAPEDYGIIEDDAQLSQRLAEVLDDEELNYSDIEKPGAIEKIITGSKKLSLLKGKDISDAEFFNRELIRASKLNSEKNTDAAIEVISNLIKEYAPKFPDNDTLKNHCCRNSLELLLYANIYHPYNYEANEQKNLRPIPVDLMNAYLMLASSFIIKGDINSALDSALHAVSVSPANVQALLILADVYKRKRYWQTFKALVKRALFCSYRRSDIAVCYHSLAQYYIEIEDYEFAAVLVYASKHFGLKPELAAKEIERIQKAASAIFAPQKPEELKAAFAKHGIFWGARDMTISLAKHLEEQFAVRNKDKPNPFSAITAELTRE